MTRNAKTVKNYRDRARRIAQTEEKTAGRKLAPLELVTVVMMKDLRPASIRQYRAALTFTMNEGVRLRPEHAADLNAAITLLSGWRSRGSTADLRTSQWKKKADVADDLVRIRHHALATTSENADKLVAALDCGELTGARFVEWPTAIFGPSTTEGYAWELVLTNGKNSNGRTHGETRTLRWTELPDHLVSQLQFWITVAKTAASEERFDTLQDTLESLMRRTTKALFPRRTETEHPTLSSVRHAAAARFKAAYVATANTQEEKLRGLAMVAALLGHASDASATAHYARADGRDKRYPVPVPDALEIARVRQRYSQPDLGKDPKPDTSGPEQHV
ncbi:type II secretory pathway component PulJ [Bradyrhizobium sp. CIR18]|uniref:hypothetical protein n=1 Tax=Bradyrhizobium sp. CIR18 TaxID=2663839 RepID=UPI0016064623|nr:hypothetical protein [Bradyrhizobium sp. CIR18]MBB4366764.1 type II secretory pathway component PulJ [Bradyrhizobium sp. CIR18]